MKTKVEIQAEAEEIYQEIVNAMKEMKCDHCQSWWLNSINFKLKSGLSTPQINQRCRILVKQGRLVIDKSRTSTSNGTCYKLPEE